MRIKRNSWAHPVKGEKLPKCFTRVGSSDPLVMPPDKRRIKAWGSDRILGDWNFNGVLVTFQRTRDYFTAYIKSSEGKKIVFPESEKSPAKKKVASKIPSYPGELNKKYWKELHYVRVVRRIRASYMTTRPSLRHKIPNYFEELDSLGYKRTSILYRDGNRVMFKNQGKNAKVFLHRKLSDADIVGICSFGKKYRKFIADMKCGTSQEALRQRNNAAYRGLSKTAKRIADWIRENIQEGWV